MAQVLSLSLFSLLPLILPIMLSFGSHIPMKGDHGFEIIEATINDIHIAFEQNKLTSRKLVEYYLKQIHDLNSALHAIIEVNPDALYLADKADKERMDMARGSMLPRLHGIPIMLEDNIATKDKMNTTAGSFALLGSIVTRDATMVTKLRKVGAIILGKANMAEWSGYRSTYLAFNSWSARGGSTKNPYTMVEGGVTGSSSGSAISVAANMVTVSLGIDSSGSMLLSAYHSSLVGIRPTTNLISSSGIVSISERYDTMVPMCRTVSDVVQVLDSAVGFESLDEEATIIASNYIPKGGYLQYLKVYGLKEKRLGVLKDLSSNDHPTYTKTLELHFGTLRKQGATLVDGLRISNIKTIKRWKSTAERAILADFKTSLNGYLHALAVSPVRSLKDVIEFNKKNIRLELIKQYPQDILRHAQRTDEFGSTEKGHLSKLQSVASSGFEELIKINNLDAVIVTDAEYVSTVLPAGGFPVITIPAGYHKNGLPFGIFFAGLKGSEPKLIEIAYAFEQATKMRRSPLLHNMP